MNITDIEALAFRDVRPTEADVFGVVTKAILFRESNGCSAVLIDDGRRGLSET